MAVKSLNDCFTFRAMNGKSDIISKSTAELLNKGTVLTIKELEEPLLIIKKNFKYPLKYKVIEAFEKGDIILMTGPKEIRFPSSFPFFLTSNNGRVISVVNVDIYGTMDGKGNMKIDAKKLYCMMEGAYMALIYFNKCESIKSRNTVITSGASIYSAMFTRILNKKYALNIDRNKQHKVLYLASKFYMINILQMKDGDSVNNYALRTCVGGNPMILAEANDALEIEDYKDLSTFLQALTKSELNLGMDDLTVRGYLESFISLYDASAVLALESFPYFVYNILSVTNGAYINNQYVLEDMVGKHGAKIYVDLIQLGE